MFAEDELLPISALQHFLFCERQCALIHIERLWAENRFTVEGEHLHRRAHEPRGESRGSLRVARGLSLRSLTLGLVGTADVVEFHPGEPPKPFPVEYKRGKPKSHDADRVQLCAQALCLEEMLCVDVPAGALYYGKTRRRREVVFDARLRSLTKSTCDRVHQLLASRRTPSAIREAKCDSCSLLHLCLPEVIDGRRSASRYFDRALRQALSGTGPAAEDA